MPVKGARRREREAAAAARPKDIMPNVTESELRDLILLWYHSHDKFDDLLKHYKGDAIMAGTPPDIREMIRGLDGRIQVIIEEGDVTFTKEDGVKISAVNLFPPCDHNSWCGCDLMPRETATVDIFVRDGKFIRVVNDYWRFEETELNVVDVFRHMALSTTPEFFLWLDRVAPSWGDDLKALLKKVILQNDRPRS